MRKQTRALLQDWLKLRQSWTKDGKLQYDIIRTALWDVQEAAYYDDYYWPKVVCFCSVLRASGKYPKAKWDIVRFGYREIIVCDWTYSLPIVELFERAFWDEVDSKWQVWFDIPDEQEIMDIGIRPPMFWPVENKDGTVQEGLF